MGFGVTGASRESVNPFCARGRLFEIKQFAVRLRVKRIAALEMLQAGDVAFKRSKQLDQIREAVSNNLSASRLKSISAIPGLQERFDRCESSALDREGSWDKENSDRLANSSPRKWC